MPRLVRLICPAVLAAFLAAAGAVPAMAQTDDCDSVVTQADINACADRDYEDADQALNATYKATVAIMKEYDIASATPQNGALARLKAAQRAWVTFRDAACEAEGFIYRGGSVEAAVVANCMTRLTQARTEDLMLLEDRN